MPSLPRVQSVHKELQHFFTHSEGRDLAGSMNFHLALDKAVPIHPKHPSNPQPVPMEAGALRGAACPQGMRPGLTVPFSSLPTSWLNVSKPAGKHTAHFSAQTPPKEQSSINKVYGRREALETSPQARGRESGNALREAQLTSESSPDGLC